MQKYSNIKMGENLKNKLVVANYTRKNKAICSGSERYAAGEREIAS
jgi:hypothetical protein